MEDHKADDENVDNLAREDDDVPLSGGAATDRMKYYQYRFESHSSDEDDDSLTRRPDGMNNDSKVVDLEDGEEDNEGTDDEYTSFANEYAPLCESGYANEENEEDEEFGDFQAVAISQRLTSDNIDNIIAGVLDRTDAPRRRQHDISMFENISNDPTDPIESWKPFDEGSNGERQANKIISSSIPPLSEEKIQTIREVMSKISLKPPSSSSAALADAIEQSRLRCGDEISK